MKTDEIQNNKNIAIRSTSSKGRTEEFNLISWNDKEPKYDIRYWSPDHSKMGKGVTLTGDDIEMLKNVLKEM